MLSCCAFINGRHAKLMEPTHIMFWHMPESQTAPVNPHMNERSDVDETTTVARLGIDPHRRAERQEPWRDYHSGQRTRETGRRRGPCRGVWSLCRGQGFQGKGQEEDIC